MITPKELFLKVEKIIFKVLSSHFRGESVFPLVIPSNKQVNGNNYTDWKNDLVPLYEQSKASKGKGYTVDWKIKMINGTKQSVPSKIYFESLEDYLFFINKSKDFLKISEIRAKLLSSHPKLEDWTNKNLAMLLEKYELWNDLIKVCNYFITNPPPHNVYLRELPIEVHSKFIEQNVSVLKKLLDILLPSEWVCITEFDFSSRYFIKKSQVYTQIRILDESLKSYLGYDECSLTLDDAAWLKWTPQKVFIIENLSCFLSFPKVSQAVAIFGEGFKSRLTKDIPWLHKTQLYCWFDLDAAGFEMLHMIKEHYPSAISLFMGLETYNKFKHFSVDNSRTRKVLSLLSRDEKEVYDFLLENRKRLEQERISHSYLLNCLSNLFSVSKDLPSSVV